jgi:hypothetical protein
MWVARCTSGSEGHRAVLRTLHQERPQGEALVLSPHVSQAPRACVAGPAGPLSCAGAHTCEQQCPRLLPTQQQVVGLPHGRGRPRAARHQQRVPVSARAHGTFERPCEQHAGEFGTARSNDKARNHGTTINIGTHQRPLKCRGGVPAAEPAPAAAAAANTGLQNAAPGGAASVTAANPASTSSSAATCTRAAKGA